MRGLLTSPNDPLFYMHHRNLDRLWKEWQDDNPGTTDVYSGSLGNGREATVSDMLEMRGLGQDLSVQSTLDTSKAPLCYRYSSSIIGRASPITKRETVDPKLKYVTPLPNEYLVKHYNQEKQSSIRAQEAHLRKIVDKLNAIGFISPASINRMKSALRHGYQSVNQSAFKAFLKSIWTKVDN